MRIGNIAATIIGLLTLAAAASGPVFFDASLEPPAGRVISGWGQFSNAWGLGQPAGKGEADDLAAYEKAVAPHAPAMISFYLTLDRASVAGFLMHYREFAATHGFFVAQIAINFHGAEHDAAIGMLDPDLMVLGDGLSEVGRPVLMRIGYQFNSPGALYEPSAYIGAFRHASDIMHKAHLNFATVWDAAANGFSDPHYMKWYPGDDVVDWWGIDLSEGKDFSRTETAAFIEDAARHRKPVVLNAALRDAKSEAEALKSYASLFDFLRANSALKAFSLRWPAPRLVRWAKVAAYVKQQLADPRFIDGTEAPAIFRPPRSGQ